MMIMMAKMMIMIIIIIIIARYATKAKEYTIFVYDLYIAIMLQPSRNITTHEEIECVFRSYSSDTLHYISNITDTLSEHG